MIGPKNPGLSVYSDAPICGPHGHMERERDPLSAFLKAPAIQSAREAEPLSDVDACALLVKFANEGALPAREWARFMGDRTPTATTLPTIVAMVRDQIGQIVEYRERASAVLGRWWAQHLEDRAVLLPAARFIDGKFILEQRPLCRDPLTACAYAMCLLLDQSRTFGKALCRCRAPECEKFFFEIRPTGRGKPRREYCSDECAAAGHRMQIRDAVRRGRAKAKAKARKHK